MTVGEKIHLLRKRARLTQQVFAEKIGISHRAAVYYEKGERYPPDETLQRIAELFDLPVEKLTDEKHVIQLTKQEQFIERARAEDQKRGKTEAERFLDKCHAFFAGGNVSEEDMDLVFESLTELFFDAKRNAKEKYGKKKPDDKT